MKLSGRLPQVRVPYFKSLIPKLDRRKVDISINIPLRMSNKPYEIWIMQNITGRNKIQLISMEQRISSQPKDSCTELLQFSYFFTRRPVTNESRACVCVCVCVCERERERERVNA